MSPVIASDDELLSILAGLADGIRPGHTSCQSCVDVMRRARAVLLALYESTPNVPGDDPLDQATAWLSYFDSCDPECTRTHRIVHSVVSAAVAEARIARIAVADGRQVRQEVARLLRGWKADPPRPEMTAWLRHLADLLDPGEDG